MHAKLLTDQLTATLAQIEALQERHQQAIAYHAAEARTRFLTERFSALLQELEALRLIAECSSSPATAQSILRDTRHTLRSLEPRSLEHLGRALVDNSLELLEIAGFVAAATALVAGHIVQLARQALDFVSKEEESPLQSDSPLCQALAAAADPSPLSPTAFQRLRVLRQHPLLRETASSSDSSCEAPLN